MTRITQKKMKSRAWNLLRLALLWARKGGIFKNRILVDFRLICNYVIKSLSHSDDRRALHYGERELSLDDTPIIHLKMHRPRASALRFKMPNIPCINPSHVDFDYDDTDIEAYNYNYSDRVEGRKSLVLKNGDADDHHEDQCWEDAQVVYGEISADRADEEGIDVKAEKFIAKFYEEMKLQRQISYLQYKEMLRIE